MLNTQIPITNQPQDKIQQTVDAILARYQDCTSSIARKKVMKFLKNCRYSGRYSRKKKKDIVNNEKEKCKVEDAIKILPGKTAGLENNSFCEKCGKNFKSKKLLQSHVNGVHNKVKPYHCDQCTKSFQHPGNLKAHKLFRHENIRKFQCDKCPLAFSSRKGLERHVLSIHETPQFTCDRCDRAFPEQCMLNRHILQIHEGQKRHKCDQCEKTFLTPGDCKRHKLSIHEGVKCEVCDICHKGFALRGNLTAHYKKVHKMAPTYKEKEFNNTSYSRPSLAPTQKEHLPAMSEGV